MDIRGLRIHRLTMHILQLHRLNELPGGLRVILNHLLVEMLRHGLLPHIDGHADTRDIRHGRHGIHRHSMLRVRFRGIRRLPCILSITELGLCRLPAVPDDLLVERILDRLFRGDIGHIKERLVVTLPALGGRFPILGAAGGGTVREPAGARPDAPVQLVDARVGEHHTTADDAARRMADAPAHERLPREEQASRRGDRVRQRRGCNPGRRRDLGSAFQRAAQERVLEDRASGRGRGQQPAREMGATAERMVAPTTVRSLARGLGVLPGGADGETR